MSQDVGSVVEVQVAGESISVFQGTVNWHQRKVVTKPQIDGQLVRYLPGVREICTVDPAPMFRFLHIPPLKAVCSA